MNYFITDDEAFFPSSFTIELSLAGADEFEVEPVDDGRMLVEVADVEGSGELVAINGTVEFIVATAIVVLLVEGTFSLVGATAAVVGFGFTVVIVAVCARTQFGKNKAITKRKISANFFFILLTK